MEITYKNKTHWRTLNVLIRMDLDISIEEVINQALKHDLSENELKLWKKVNIIDVRVLHSYKDVTTQWARLLIVVENKSHTEELKRQSLEAQLDRFSNLIND